VPARRRALYVATGDFTMADCAFLYPAVRDASGGRFRELDAERLNRAAVDKVNPFFLLESIANNPFSFLSAALGYMGPGTSLSSQSPTGRTPWSWVTGRCERGGPMPPWSWGAEPGSRRCRSWS